MTCGDWQAPNEQPFIVLNVEASSSINLQNMVNGSFEPEKLIKRCGNAGCQASIPGVGNEKSAMSQKTITNLPEVVFLQVPKIADRNTHYDHDGYITIQGVAYEVMGVLDHQGSSPKQGHFVTWKKMDCWWRCDDADLKAAIQTDTHTPDNMLFACWKAADAAASDHYKRELEAIEDDIEHMDADAIDVDFNPTNTDDELFQSTGEEETNSEKLKSEKTTCKGCGGSFSRLIMHLKQSKCVEVYNIQQIEEELKERRKKDDAERKKLKRSSRSDTEVEADKLANADVKRRSRSRRTPAEVDEDKKANAEMKRITRSRRTPAEVDEDNKANAEIKRRKRSARTPDEVDEDNKAAAERMRKHRERLNKNPNYKESQAAKKAKYRQQKFKEINKTLFGRKRAFIETVRDGPIFGCISCHRALYGNGVIEIEDIVKFREELNAAFETLFEDTISYTIDGSEVDFDSIPNTKGKHYLCFNCKKYLFTGRMPPQCHKNDLEVFDTKDYPEFELSQLEGSVIAKSILFMKIFKKPVSRMSAVKDRTICVPIDDNTINDTLTQLPRTPLGAGLVPIKLKRKLEYKNPHLQEYINVGKIFCALESLKQAGHSEYQFFEASNFDSYKERCRKEDADGYEMLFESGSSEEDEVDIDCVAAHGDEVDTMDISRQSLNDCVVEDSNEAAKEEEVDEVELCEAEEERYLRNDAVAKWQFDYNRVICFGNDFPELSAPAQNEPISLAPGEGL